MSASHRHPLLLLLHPDSDSCASAVDCTTGSVLHSGFLLIIHMLLDTLPNPPAQAATLTQGEAVLGKV